MKVELVSKNSEEAKIAIIGKVDSSNAGDFEKDLIKEVTLAKSLDRIYVDLTEMPYISSAGLRGLLKSKRIAGKNIEFINVGDDVYNIFKMTGFLKILGIPKR